MELREAQRRAGGAAIRWTITARLAVSDVKVFEVEQLIDAFKTKGKKVEYKVYQDSLTEHGFALINTSAGRQARFGVYRTCFCMLHIKSFFRRFHRLHH